MRQLRSTDQRRRQRLARLEIEARSKPAIYRLRLVGLVLLGFAAPISLLLFIAALAVAIPYTASRSAWTGLDALIPIAISLELVLLVITGLMLWQFLLPPPDDDESQRLRPGQAPELLALIDQIRHATHSPPIDEIQLDMSINAGVACRRSFGIIGRQHNSMLIGLPLLATMTPGQFACILHHEFAHVRGVRSKFPSWISRMHRMWSSLPALNKTGLLSRLARRWIGWYVGLLTFYSLPARRLNEYDADASASRAGTNDSATMAQTLITLDWMTHRLGTGFWPACKRQPATLATPPNDILAQMVEFIAQAPPPTSVERWAAYERACRTPVHASHPSMIDRLKSLGADLPENPSQHSNPRLYASLPPAASALSLLGAAHDEIVSEANARWKGLIIGSWRQRRAFAKYCADEAEQPCDLPEPEPQWRRVNAITETLPPIEARAKLAEFVQQYPDHAMATFKLACFLLDEHDESAAALLHRVAESDAELACNALRALLGFYRESGRDTEADAIYEKLEAANLVSQRFSRVSRSDRFEPHQLSPMQLDSIRRSFVMYPQFRVGYVVRRASEQVKGAPVHLVAIRTVGLHGQRARRSIESARNLVREPVHLVLMSSVPRGARRRIRGCCPHPIHFDGL